MSILMPRGQVKKQVVVLLPIWVTKQPVPLSLSPLHSNTAPLHTLHKHHPSHDRQRNNTRISYDPFKSPLSFPVELMCLVELIRHLPGPSLPLCARRETTSSHTLLLSLMYTRRRKMAASDSCVFTIIGG